MSLERHHGDEAYDCKNMRANRSEAFVMDMGEGAHRLSCTVRATAPGVFLAAPDP
jgi:hypothetical protein